MSDNSTPQHKIGSGFGARSTADDVLEGIDLTGRLALVTGGYSGIGIETTRALTKAGARVVVPARRVGAAQENLAGIDGVEVAELDLGDLDSVGAFAEGFLATKWPLDIVIDSAGIMACPETRVGPGWEAQFATNHLGHFALVNRLWLGDRAGWRPRRLGLLHRPPCLARPLGRRPLAQRLRQVGGVRPGQDGERAVRRAARPPRPGPGRAGVLAAPWRHPDSPSAASAEAGDGRAGLDRRGRQPALSRCFQDTAAGCGHAGVGGDLPQLNGMGGVYLEDCDIAEPAPADGTRVGVKEWATDPEQAARLWTLSAELTGVDAFAA